MPDVCLRERYAEDRSVCGCKKCRHSLAVEEATQAIDRFVKSFRLPIDVIQKP